MNVIMRLSLFIFDSFWMIKLYLVRLSAFWNPRPSKFYKNLINGGNIVPNTDIRPTGDGASSSSALVKRTSVAFELSGMSGKWSSSFSFSSSFSPASWNYPTKISPTDMSLLWATFPFLAAGFWTSGFASYGFWISESFSSGPPSLDSVTVIWNISSSPLLIPSLIFPNVGTGSCAPCPWP